MRNVSLAVVGLLLATSWALLGCDARNPSGNSGKLDQSFVTKRVPIEFMFPAGWHPNPDEHPFELQCLSPTREMNAGVFVFKTEEDLSTDSTPTDILWDQVNDLKAKRDSFDELEPAQTQEYEDKTVTSVTYVGEKDSSRYCYTFSLIEFRPASPTFAIAIQVSTWEDWKRSKPVLESIVRTARLMPDGK